MPLNDHFCRYSLPTCRYRTSSSIWTPLLSVWMVASLCCCTVSRLVSEERRPPSPRTPTSYTLKQVSPHVQESVTHTKTPPFRTRIPWEEKGGKNAVVAKRLTDRPRDSLTEEQPLSRKRQQTGGGGGEAASSVSRSEQC